MNFYSANKEYFDCPEPFFPLIDKGTVAQISMVFSLGSVILLSFINPGNEKYTLQYGKDWWKSLQCKRQEVPRFGPFIVLFVTLATMIVIAIMLIYTITELI